MFHFFVRTCQQQLEEIKAKRGGALRPEDGTIDNDKSLYAILLDAKQAKEDEFQEGWKIMKQGKNKPLDEEEIEFFDELEESKREADNKRKKVDQEDIANFHVMRETMIVRAAPEPKRERKAPPPPAPKQKSLIAPKKPPLMVVKAKPKVPPPAAKADEEEGSGDEGGGLGGLLGYGSGSD